MSASDNDVLTALRSAFTPGTLTTDAAELDAHAVDQGPLEHWQVHPPLAVVFAESTQDVQLLVRLSCEHGFALITRGAGTSVSGGANSTEGSVVLNLTRMNQILAMRPEDEVAVVEPGVINADLNAAAAEHGLMYAPDPASYRTSTIGGNVATNAGGLRCAKYGVTRDSVLALDVVLADGTLIHTGQATFKGVAGYDLTSLFVGSEGTLGIVVGVTVRLRHLSAHTETIAAFFDELTTAAQGVLDIGRARVQPAITELLDRRTMLALDEAQGSDLAQRGDTLLLIQTDGHGAAIEAEIIREVLRALGALVSDPGSTESERLIELRRHARGDGIVNEVRVGEDVAVPRSRLVDYIRAIEDLAEEHQVQLKVVAHAGDGNLHPTFSVPSSELGPDTGTGTGTETRPDDDAASPAQPEAAPVTIDATEGGLPTSAVSRLHAALDGSVRLALEMGGTITGEHGIGTYKLRWLDWEQSAEVIALQRRIKDVFDPERRLNPGRAIL
ncbi:FAD-binding protein [Nesterenkonia sp. YGD6]|uniref:FAD-binding oxidoreductase n=1 Tax=Nesterenkonia sp. YGD6 TaxID=2901231 RepID=UPI001F4D281F|nr:FAD-linked oxidase C-terminal domain-containing protein [Nesterenkonia sp. YGD6]MCH8562109.1 FAD-binding protein [Nesterenkonia sp. YGD6]